MGKNRIDKVKTGLDYVNIALAIPFAFFLVIVVFARLLGKL